MDIHEYMENHRHGYDLVKGKRIKFKYYDFERDFINHIIDNRFSITKKSRQIHVTNLLSHYVTWFLIFNEDRSNKEIGYVSHNMDLSVRFISLVSENLRDFFDVPIKLERDNKTCIEMINGNRIKAIAATRCSMRGWTFNRVIMDEIAFVKDFDEIYALYMTSLGTGGYMTLASTPNGIETFFKIWSASIRGENDFKTLHLDWTKNPRRDIGWYEKMCEMIGDEDTIDQELHAKFTSYSPYSKSLKLGLIEPKFTPDPRTSYKPYIPYDYSLDKVKVVDNSFKGKIKRMFSFLGCG
jgi:phage FluMu gp28-like protein